MNQYNVHIYREMRLVYVGIEADTPEAAAAIARTMPTADADDIESCDGETFSALVDVQGDEEHERSHTVDFDSERQRKAAPNLLAACRMVVERWERGDLAEAARACSAAIAEADAAGIVPESNASRLLDALQAVLPYAEAERASLCEAWRRDRDPAINVELHACDLALGDAAAAIAEAKAIGVVSNPAEIDVHALLAQRRQIAVIWSVEDVRAVAPNLTDDQCWEVLQQAERRHDAEIGINWTVLISHADSLLGEADGTDAAEEA